MHVFMHAKSTLQANANGEINPNDRSEIEKLSNCKSIN